MNEHEHEYLKRQIWRDLMAIAGPAMKMVKPEDVWKALPPEVQAFALEEMAREEAEKKDAR